MVVDEVIVEGRWNAENFHVAVRRGQLDKAEIRLLNRTRVTRLGLLLDRQNKLSRSFPRQQLLNLSRHWIY
jgi:hypothetical protein